MYKILKFKWDDRKNHFWSSDFHNYHNPSWDVPIWKMRGYSSYEESFGDIRDKINNRITTDQYLWMLGDSFLSATDDEVVSWWKDIKCQNVMMLFGNHESQMYRLYKKELLSQFGRDDIEVYPLKMGNVTFLGNHQEIVIGKKQIIMNHFPLRIWHNDSRSSWMLSGHSHLKDLGRRPEFEEQKGLDVGWDYKNDVWSFDEIEDVMSTKSVKILDHNRDH
jgi:calcineurin-like phosphoesterase family protein